MKAIFSSLAALLLFCSPLTFAAIPLPVTMESPIDSVFIPTGFDDNDNVEIVLKGTFPNSCYRIAESSHEVDHENRTIKIKAEALHYESYNGCLEVLTNFLQPVKVGLLKHGRYDVYLENADNLSTEVSIAEAKTEAPDDFLYANVENAFVDVVWETGKQRLEISGHHPYYLHGCQVITEVRTYFDPKEVLVVLPITKIVEGEACDKQPEDRSFTKTIPLKAPFLSDGIVHVRTLNGQSINRFVTYFP